MAYCDLPNKWESLQRSSSRKLAQISRWKHLKIPICFTNSSKDYVQRRADHTASARRHCVTFAAKCSLVFESNAAPVAFAVAVASALYNSDVCSINDWLVKFLYFWREVCWIRPKPRKLWRWPSKKAWDAPQLATHHRMKDIWVPWDLQLSTIHRNFNQHRCS